MRCLLAIAVLAMLPIAAAGQRRGVSAGMRMAPAPAPMSRGFRRVPSRGPMARFSPQWGRRIRPGRFGFGHFGFGQPSVLNRCFSDAFFDPFFCRRFAGPGQSFFPSFFSTYPYVGSLSYDDSDYSYAAAQQVARANAQASDLAGQLQQLRNELEELQVSRQSAAAPQPAPPAAAYEQPSVPTTLVFRDGRRAEVENYAIVDETLWIFSKQSRKKLPLSELDLAATEKANDERGVDFLLPRSSP